MKSKNPKIQILMKGITISLITMFTITPVVFAASNLDDSYLKGSIINKVLYGTVGSTVKEIEEYFSTDGNITLYIYNETQLRAFAEYVNSGHDCKGKEIKLLNNIIVNSNEEWIPIGNSDNRFKGTFDGQGYTISGVNFNRGDKLDSELANVGLFGYVQDSVIKNITLANSKFDIPYNVSSDILYKSEDISEEFDGSSFVSKFQNIGGIVGYSYNGIVENCKTNSDVTISGLVNVGGIVGCNYEGTIKNCINNGNIEGLANIGGIVGRNSGNSQTININNVVDFSKDSVGKVINCSNEEDANIYTLIGAGGGIAGSATWNSIIQGCTNSGKINATTEKIKMNVLGITIEYEPQNIGGIAGYVSGGYNENTFYTAIDGCINFEGAIAKGYKDVGGIAGQFAGQSGGYAIMTNCINYSTNVVATAENSSVGEAGYLAGEVGSYGFDKKEPADDSIAIIYNSLYFMPGGEESAKFAKEAEHQTLGEITLGYGYIANENGKYLYNKNVTTFVKNAYSNNSLYIVTDDAEEFVNMKDYDFENPIGLDKFYPISIEKTTNTKIDLEPFEKFDVYSDESKYTYIYDKNIDGFNLNSNNEYTIDTKTGTTVKYSIYKGDSLTNGKTYFKAGDTLKIKAEFNKYLAKTYGPLAEISEAPTLKLNNSIEMKAGSIDPSKSNYTTSIEYTYTVKEGDNIEVKNLSLTLNGTVYAITGSDYETNHPQINSKAIMTEISEIYFDTIAPTINTKVYVEDALETGRYTKGKEILIDITTSEAIDGDFVAPKVQVSFSGSGIGKYNYTKEPETVGYAKCEASRRNIDGTVTWKYSYIIQDGDEGNLQLEYVAGEIKDLAGNVTDIKNLYTPQGSTGTEVNGGAWNNKLGVTYKFYKNKVSEENEVTSNTYFTKEDDLVVVATFDKVLYAVAGKTNDTRITQRLTNQYANVAPSLYINGMNNLKNSSVSVQTATNETIITYTFDLEKAEYNLKELTDVNKVTLRNDNNNENLEINERTVSPNGQLPFSEEFIDDYEATSENILTGNTKKDDNVENVILDPIGVSNKIEQDNIYADTKAPTVDIAVKSGEESVDSLTNKNTFIYTFTFSEEVTEFTKDDVKVTNGTIKELVQSEDKKVYTATIDTTIADGNVGDMEVVVEQDACKDLVGYGNIRNSKVITVDRRAAMLVSLEAHATSDVTVSKDVDIVKEYYKVGDTVTIIATFNENIENTEKLPVLALQFSESGNAKTAVSEGTVNGNKITYTYTITAGDKGTLSVKGFSGTVVDSAGNETIVTKRALDGDTIIADTKAPKIEEIKVVNPSDGTYKAGTTITFEVKFDEEIYALKDNEIGLITSSNAPILSVKFGSANPVTATAVGYGENENGKDRTKIVYQYTIKDGENGKLAIVSYKNVENAFVCDIAGNKADLSAKQIENEIIADTIRPEVTNITAKVENPIISNTDIYYKEGNEVKITLTFNEKVSSNVVLWPTLKVGFSETGEKPAKYEDYAIESDWNVNSQTIEYTYKIKDGDNGYLWVELPENQFADIAGNGNIEKAGTRISNIYADTTKPTVTLLRDTDVNQNNQTITVRAQFSENVYDLNNNSRVNLTKEKAPKLIYSFGDGENKEIAASSVSGDTIIYTIKKDAIEDNGTLHYELAKGNLCDRAGNVYYQETTDTTAPILEKVIISNNSEHGIYCKKDVEMYITAIFNEEISSQNMKIKVNIGEKEVDLTGTVNSEDKKQVIFTYKVQDNDNGKLEIIDVLGNTLDDEKLEDKTFGTVADKYGNTARIFNLKGIKVEGEGKAIADTEIPTVIITTDVKTNKTNANQVEYTFIWSEVVDGFTVEDLIVKNGTINSFKQDEKDSKVYKLIVDTESEGIQTVILNADACIDLAGNPNTRVLYNKVTIDQTKPVILAKINGGNYVVDSDKEKSTFKEIITVNEKITEFKYIWSEKNELPKDTENWETKEVSEIEIGSNINIPYEASKAGTYYLYIKVVDEAGNETIGKTNGFVVSNSIIKIEVNETKPTNQDVIATITYGDGLTENKKAGVSGISQSADSSKVIVTENGTVYAEATDLAGNKVYATKEVTNIDKTAPEATIKYVENEDKSVTATITFNEDAVITNNEGKDTYTFTENGEFTFEFKDAVGNKSTATAKVTTIVKEPEVPPVEEDKTAPEIIFNYTTTMDVVGATIGATITTNEDAVISYSWDNKNWTPSNGYVRSLKAVTKPGKAGEYTLYAKAIDKSGNTSKVSELKFTLVNSEEDIRKPEVIFEDLTTIQKNGVKYVKVSPKFTIDELNAKMDKDALLGRTVEYKKLTDDNKLRTGSEITIDGDIKYIVIVNGDVNCDGKVDFLGDIVMINNFRIGATKDLKDIQILAGDINNSGEIDFIPDIVAMNNYRLGRIEVL